MSYMCGGGRGTGGRGTGCRRTQRSPTGRRVAEEAGALAGEAMGGGGRGTRVTPRVSKPHDYANHMFMRL
jgi:hypothetical protein